MVPLSLGRVFTRNPLGGADPELSRQTTNLRCGQPRAYPNGKGQVTVSLTDTWATSNPAGRPQVLDHQEICSR